MSVDAVLSKESAEQSSSEAMETPKDYLIAQNYPNPFNPTTTIKYQLPQAGFVTLKVYDALGNEVKSLVNGNEDAGYYEVNFNASNLASGLYFYQIKSNGFISTKKMILTK